MLISSVTGLGVLLSSLLKQANRSNNPGTKYRVIVSAHCDLFFSQSGPSSITKQEDTTRRDFFLPCWLSTNIRRDHQQMPQEKSTTNLNRRDRNHGQQEHFLLDPSFSLSTIFFPNPAPSLRGPGLDTRIASPAVLCLTFTAH